MNKYSKLEIRLTDEEKAKIKVYAAKSGKTMSEVIRELCNKIFKEDQKQ